MTSFDNDRINHILMQLDDGGYLFPQFELSKLNKDPIVLGEGGFSLVLEMTNKARMDLKYALKVVGLKKQMISSEEFQTTGKLQWILSQDSKYVARVLELKELQIEIDENDKLINVTDQIKEAWEEEKGIHLQFVLMEKLEKIIIKDRFKKVSLLRNNLNNESEILKLAFEIGQALNSAHNYNVLHRDIKLENIFWDEHEKIYKLGDFGFAKYSEDGNAATVIYTNGYGAPEIERNPYEVYNLRADIYSFGITLYLLFNNLKFPGSSGYYPKAAVQYNPEFVFPAPENATEEITKVIRKMCSYRAKDRYSSIAEALSDLADNMQVDNDIISEQLIDMATQTFHEENPDDKEIVAEEKEMTRAERIEDQIIMNEIFHEDSVKYGMVICALFVLVYGGMHGNIDYTNNLMFYVMTMAVFFEAICQCMKEFHIVFGILTIGIILSSIFQTGMILPHLFMIITVLVGYPTLTFACSISTGIWMALQYSDIWLHNNIIWKFDCGWIFLIFLLVVVFKYILVRFEFDKNTAFQTAMAWYIFFDILYIMILAGIILVLLQVFHLITIPELLNRIHFVRTGSISLPVIYIILYRNLYLFDEGIDQNEEEEDNTEYIYELDK